MAQLHKQMLTKEGKVQAFNVTTPGEKYMDGDEEKTNWVQLPGVGFANKLGGIDLLAEADITIKKGERIHLFPKGAPTP